MPFRKRAPESPAPAPRDAAEAIDAMMALPIKEPAAVTIFGDEDVVGVSPARPD